MTKTIQVRVDENLKDSADKLFSSLGLDTSTAIRMFLVASIDAGGIPFVVRKETLEDREKRLMTAVAYREAGGEYLTADDSFAFLNLAIERGRAARNSVAKNDFERSALNV